MAFRQKQWCRIYRSRYRFLFFLCLETKKQNSRRKAISIFSSRENLRNSARKICISLLFAKTSRTLTNICVCLFNSITLKVSKNQIKLQFTIIQAVFKSGRLSDVFFKIIEFLAIYLYICTRK